MGDQAVGLVTSGTYYGRRDAAAPTRRSSRPGTRNTATSCGPTSCPPMRWDGMQAIFDLIKQTKGKFTGDEAMAFFKGWKDRPEPARPDHDRPETRDIIQNVYMRRVEKKDGKLVNVEFETLGMMTALGQPYSAK